MREALLEAQRALDEDEVPVGCVIVHKGTVVGRGHNRTNVEKNATRHAELVALDKLRHSSLCAEMGGLEALMQQSELYVTVEPCIMCAAALMLVHVGAVFFGCHNDRFGGCGSTMDVVDTFAKPVQQLAEGAGPSSSGKRWTSSSPAPLVQIRRSAPRSYPYHSGLLRDEAVQMLRNFYGRPNPNAPVEKARTRTTHKFQTLEGSK